MSLRVRFLFAVNLTLLAALTIFLVMDFQYQWSTHLAELSADTKREAELLAQTIRHLDSNDRAALQSFVDKVSDTLQSGEPSRHDFAAVVAENVTLGPSGGPTSVATIEKLIRHTGERKSPDASDWVIGEAAAGDYRVYVLRNVAQARSFSEAHALWRVAEVALLGLLATAIINLLLMRLVIQPFLRLAETIRRIGEGEYGATTGRFRSRELRALAADIDQMSLALARATRDRANQMTKAGRLQQRLQSDGVAVPGLEVVHWHEAADHVAGDYFDLLRCPDGDWLICIADVTGHGVAAAMGAAILKTLLWSAVDSGADLDRILHTVNQRFSDVTLEEDFASLLLIRWSHASGTLQYASAGHETAYLLTEGESPGLLESTGTLVGISHDQVWDIKSVDVEPGSRLVLYTDGITEARSPAGELFGRARLERLIRRQAPSTIRSLTDEVAVAIRSHLNGLPATDDLTLVTLEFSGHAEDQPATRPVANRIGENS